MWTGPTPQGATTTTCLCLCSSQGPLLKTHPVPLRCSGAGGGGWGRGPQEGSGGWARERADKSRPGPGPWGSFQALSWPGVAEDYYAHFTDEKVEALITCVLCSKLLRYILFNCRIGAKTRDLPSAPTASGVESLGSWVRVVVSCCDSALAPYLVGDGSELTSPRCVLPLASLQPEVPGRRGPLAMLSGITGTLRLLHLSSYVAAAMDCALGFPQRQLFTHRRQPAVCASLRAPGSIGKSTL